MKDGEGFVRIIDILSKKKLVNIFKFDGLKLQID